MNRNMFQLMEEENCSLLSLSAVDMGPYVWARTGVTSTSETLYKRQLPERLKTIEANLPESTLPETAEYISHIRSMLKEPTEKTILNIVDLDRPFEADKNLSWGKAMTFPKYMLPKELNIKADIHYSGFLDFRKPEIKKRAYKYVGLNL